MRIAPWLLGLSAVANVALVAVVVRRGSDEGARSAEVARASGAPQQSVASDARAGVANEPQRGVAVDWQAINAGELKEVVARLRKAGFPASAIRGIVWARLRDEFKEKQEKLFAGVEEPPYWRAGSRNFDAKLMAAVRELTREQSALVKELLGEDAVEEHPWTRLQRKRMFGDIPASKAEELQQIVADYGELRGQVYADANGVIMPEDREKIRYLEAEMRNDLARVLDPVELENYELRSSSIANSLRSQLTTFTPTEDEFRALFRVAQSVDADLGGVQGAMTPEETRRRIAAINERAKQVLAPERFAAFEQAMDPRYGGLNRIAARYELPSTVVPQVYSVQQDIQRRAAELRSLPVEQRVAQTAALVQEAATRIEPLLGERGFEAYKVYGGQWMEGLTRMAGAGGAGPMAPVVPPRGTGATKAP